MDIFAQKHKADQARDAKTDREVREGNARFLRAAEALQAKRERDVQRGNDPRKPWPKKFYDFN